MGMYFQFNSIMKIKPGVDVKKHIGVATDLLKTNGGTLIEQNGHLVAELESDVNYGFADDIRTAWMDLAKAVADFSDGSIKVDDLVSVGGEDDCRTQSLIGPQKVVLQQTLKNVEAKIEDLNFKATKLKKFIQAAGSEVVCQKQTEHAY